MTRRRLVPELVLARARMRATVAEARQLLVGQGKNPRTCTFDQAVDALREASARLQGRGELDQKVAVSSDEVEAS
jgi:hypothetical protein